jgi:hypothetical protein
MEGEKKNAVSVYSLYRKSTLGICLQDSLDELQEKNHIGADLAQKVLEQFDKVPTSPLDCPHSHAAATPPPLKALSGFAPPQNSLQSPFLWGGAGLDFFSLISTRSDLSADLRAHSLLIPGALSP